MLLAATRWVFAGFRREAACVGLEYEVTASVALR
jgi:hypothetical protein